MEEIGSVVRALVKIPILVTLVSAYFFNGLVLLPLFVWRSHRLRYWRARNSGFYCTGLVWLFGLKPAWTGSNERPEDPSVIVSNHLSYLDVFIIASRLRAVFVTSVEVEQSFPLGLFAKAAGCVFVERRRRTNAAEQVQMIKDVLKSGCHVVIFPEATSSAGEMVLPFRASLFECAVQGGNEVLPLCLNYQAIDGKAIGSKSRDLVFYYGDMNFGPHFWQLLQLKEVAVQACSLGRLSGEMVKDRKALSEEAFRLISEAFVPIRAQHG